MGDARPLFKLDNQMTDAQKIASLERRLVKERELRKQAELNARRFHAMLLRERVAAIVAKHKDSDV